MTYVAVSKHHWSAPTDSGNDELDLTRSCTTDWID